MWGGRVAHLGLLKLFLVRRNTCAPDDPAVSLLQPDQSSSRWNTYGAFIVASPVDFRPDEHGWTADATEP